MNTTLVKLAVASWCAEALAPVLVALAGWVWP
jgi:hypothetical protein